MERRSLLRPLSARGFRLLFVSASASSVGTLLAAVALAIDVKDRTNSGWWVGALMIVEFLPTIAVGLAFGPLLDRLSRRGLMVGADVVRAAVFCALPFVGSAAAIVGLAALAGLANGFFRPAVYAGMPNLVPDEELPAANSLLVTVENLSWAVGPLLGGVLTAAWGPHTAYWLNAASFVVSAVLLSGISRSLLQSEAPLSRGYWQDVGDGWRAVRASRALVAVLVTWSLAMAASGGVNVGEVFLAKNTFHGGDIGFGVLYGAIGVGLVLGSAVGGLVQARAPLPLLYGGAIAVMALGFGTAAASPNVWVAAVLAGVAGLGNGMAIVTNILLVQRGAPDSLRGRALTVVMGANYLVLALAMVGAAPLLDAVGPRWLWAISAFVLLVAAAIGAATTRRVELAGGAPELVAERALSGVSA